MRRALAVAALLCVPATAAADGYRVQQGGPSFGNAGAGASADARDPSTVYFNPAGMSELGAPATSSIASPLRVSVRYSNDAALGATRRRLTGGDGKDAGTWSLPPSLFAVLPGDGGWTWGLGVTAPFGVETDYGRRWVGRYHATRTELRMIDVSPCVARRLSDAVSVGAGLDVQFLRTRLDNQIDFGALAVKELGPGEAASLGLRPGRDDGRASLRGESTGLGAVAGLLWKPDDATRAGVSLRSAVRHRIDGEARFALPGAAQRFRLGGYFLDTSAETTLTLPETVSAGVVRALSPEADLCAQLDWTRWSRFETLRVRFGNPRQDPLVEQEGWRDGLRPSLGATWRPGARWTFRAGVAWDPPVCPDANRRPRAPDAGRLTLAAGASLRLSERVTLDAAYLHAWFQDAPIDLDDRVAGRLRGTLRAEVDYLSLGVTFRF